MPAQMTLSGTTHQEKCMMILGGANSCHNDITLGKGSLEMPIKLPNNLRPLPPIYNYQVASRLIHVHDSFVIFTSDI